MSRFAILLLVAFCAPLELAAGPAPGLFERFVPGSFDAAEKRLLQASLALEGDYAGPIDGRWGLQSQAAIERYSDREFGDVPLNMHAGALALGMLESIEALGWTWRSFPGLGISMALPERLLTEPEAEDSGTRWWSRQGSLTLLVYGFGGDETRAWHEAAAGANAEPSALLVRRGAGRLVTAGWLDDGRSFFTRSDDVDGSWATVFLASEPDEAPVLNLMQASIGIESPAALELPPEGRLDGIVAATLALVDSVTGDDAPAPGDAALRAGEAAASGTGFFVTDRVLVTAQHVIGGCRRVALADGTELRLIAEDTDLDVAALSVPRASRTWLALSQDGGIRLGQPVHALGFPYYGIAGTSLHLTGGNVSALVGVNDDDRFFSFTAPVQPGNSGGPLIAGDGAVMGLVVSRLSERFIEQATGTQPQNINYALGNDELATFLARAGVPPKAGGLPAFDAERGVPPRIETAVWPVLCD